MSLEGLCSVEFVGCVVSEEGVCIWKNGANLLIHDLTYRREKA